MSIAVVLVRTERGVNHLAHPRPSRGVFDAACWRFVRPGPRGVVWETPAEIRSAWRHELVCLDCERLAKLPPAEFARRTEWGRR